MSLRFVTAVSIGVLAASCFGQTPSSQAQSAAPKSSQATSSQSKTGQSKAGDAQPGATKAAHASGSAYLKRETTPDIAHILPPPPAIGSAEDAADREIFKKTRALAGSARWDLARNDDNQAISALFADFRCALGIALTAETAPRTAALLTSVSADAGAAVGPAKQAFQRKRPFLIDPVDPNQICVRESDTPDYPSGHTTLSWAVGLVLAELDPEHASQILTRARAYGESRVVCGMHNASAISAGRTAGSIVVAAEHSVEDFRADFEAAKKELAALRKTAADTSAGQAAACAAQAQLTGVSPY